MTEHKGTPEYITYVSHIMWQPTLECALHCDGCYMKSFAKGHEIPRPNADILNTIFVERRLYCHQFTVSLDNVLNYPVQILDGLRFLIDIYQTKTKDSLPQLCITANNWNTVQCWCREINVEPRNFLKHLSIVSLSNFPIQGKKCDELKELCKSTDTILNFNKMVNHGDHDRKSFEMGVRYADQVYLVLKKNALGDAQDVGAVKDWIRARKKVKEIAPEKLIEDVCVLASLRRNCGGTWCDAGYGKKHVWPTGTITGCPYDAKQVANETEHHPMVNCHISKALINLKKDLESLNE